MWLLWETRAKSLRLILIRIKVERDPEEGLNTSSGGNGHTSVTQTLNLLKMLKKKKKCFDYIVPNGQHN